MWWKLILKPILIELGIILADVLSKGAAGLFGTLEKAGKNIIDTGSDKAKEKMGEKIGKLNEKTNELSDKLKGVFSNII